MLIMNDGDPYGNRTRASAVETRSAVESTARCPLEARKGRGPLLRYGGRGNAFAAAFPASGAR